MLSKLGKRAQTTAEYAILIALVVGAVVAMQVYVKRGIQGRIRDVVDHTGSGGDLGSPGDKVNFTSGQYEPYYVQSESLAPTVQRSTSEEELKEAGAIERESEVEVTATKKQTIGWYGQEE